MQMPKCPLQRTPVLAFTLFFVSSCTIASASQVKPPEIIKVDPPSWWVRHSVNPVTLLVRGRNLSGSQVRSVGAALQTSNVRINERGTYLFVDVTVGSSARPGMHMLSIQSPAGKATIQFHIEPALRPEGRFQGISPDDVIYLIMPDRFANGDPSNDNPKDSPPQANDRKNARGYHGGDFRGIIDRLPYLKSLGVTALWLTPWYDNWNGINACDKPWCPNTYYHGYHAIDYYAVEDRFGSMATLRELIDKAHGLGMKVVQDQVANHVGSRHFWVHDPPLNDWFHGSLASHSLNKFQNSTVLSPHANQSEVRNTLDGWFNDDLPDMNQEQPEVARYEIQNALWWVGMTGIDGIRQDTIQYMPRFFIRDLSRALHRQYPRLWMVGEVFERDSAQTAFFIGGHKGWDGIDTNLDSVFDFALWNTSLQVFTNKLPMRALRDQLKYDSLYPDPLKVTTLQNNHDTDRFMSLPGATLEGSMMHMAFILSVRGIPQIYYGEEIAMEGGHDPDNRRDFPGGFPGDERNAFEPAGRRSKEEQMYNWTRAWLKLRAQNPSLRRGRLIDLFYDDDSYIFARQYGSETIIVAFNKSRESRVLSLPVAAIGLRDGGRLVPLTSAGAAVAIMKGNADVAVPARSVAAFKH
jgi:glycosidase